MPDRLSQLTTLISSGCAVPGVARIGKQRRPASRCGEDCRRALFLWQREHGGQARLDVTRRLRRLDRSAAGGLAQAQHPRGIDGHLGLIKRAEVTHITQSKTAMRAAVAHKTDPSVPVREQIMRKFVPGVSGVEIEKRSVSDIRFANNVEARQAARELF